MKVIYEKAYNGFIVYLANDNDSSLANYLAWGKTKDSAKKKLTNLISYEMEKCNRQLLLMLRKVQKS